MKPQPETPREARPDCPGVKISAPHGTHLFHINLIISLHIHFWMWGWYCKGNVNIVCVAQAILHLINKTRFIRTHRFLLGASQEMHNRKTIGGDSSGDIVILMRVTARPVMMLRHSVPLAAYPLKPRSGFCPLREKFWGSLSLYMGLTPFKKFVDRISCLKSFCSESSFVPFDVFSIHRQLWIVNRLFVN